MKPCIGLYGVVSYVAARKTNETSIRLAPGATRVQVLGSVLKEGMLLVIAGMAISVPATLAATRLITSLLFGVTAADLNSLGLNTPVVRIGWPNRFIEHGRLGPLHAKYGITPEAAIERLRPYLKITNRSRCSALLVQAPGVLCGRSGRAQSATGIGSNPQEPDIGKYR